MIQRVGRPRQPHRKYRLIRRIDMFSQPFIGIHRTLPTLYRAGIVRRSARAQTPIIQSTSVDTHTDIIETPVCVRDDRIIESPLEKLCVLRHEIPVFPDKRSPLPAQMTVTADPALIQDKIVRQIPDRDLSVTLLKALQTAVCTGNSSLFPKRTQQGRFCPPSSRIQVHKGVSHRRLLNIPAEVDRIGLIPLAEHPAVIGRTAAKFTADIRHCTPGLHLHAECTLLQFQPLYERIDTLPCLSLEHPAEMIFREMTVRRHIIDRQLLMNVLQDIIDRAVDCLVCDQ